MLRDHFLCTVFYPDNQTIEPFYLLLVFILWVHCLRMSLSFPQGVGGCQYSTVPLIYETCGGDFSKTSHSGV